MLTSTALSTVDKYFIGIVAAVLLLTVLAYMICRVHDVNRTSKRKKPTKDEKN